MTREEEIHNAAMDVSNHWKKSELLPTQDEIIAYDAAVTMAKWCDSHPREGLWDGKKVIAWLKEHIGEYYMINEFEEYFDSMYEDLKKSMED